jgi:hypothetical protein
LSPLLKTPGIAYHSVPNVTNTWCFSIEDVDARDFVESLLDEIVAGQVVGLDDPVLDCSRQVRRVGAGYQTKRICHGSFTDPWHDATRQNARDWLLPAADSMIRNRAHGGWLFWSPDPSTRP